MVKVIVPISGGKDSQACLKLAIQKHGNERVAGLFCDTQWEHPETYKHVAHMESLYQVKIYKVTGGSVPEKVLKYQRFPVLGQRFCTDELKMRETKMFLKTFAEEQGPCEVWYGMRSSESPARRKRYSEILDTDLYQPHEVFPGKYPKYLGKLGIRFMMPILNWSTAEVLDFLDGAENPLYKMGFDRVGCFPCLAASDRQKEKVFVFDDFGKEQYKKVLWLEQETGKSVYTTQSARSRRDQLELEGMEGNGCSICSI